jgi:hypothetical protein
MTDPQDTEIERALRDALPPRDDLELARDLWPEMSERISAAAPGRISWFDWALAAAAILWMLMFPETLLPLLYHF